VTLDLDVVAIPRCELPRLLGEVVRVEAEIRLRLAEVPTTPGPAASRPLDADQAAVIAGATPRWLREHTRGMAFRRDLSRKAARFDEAGLRKWLAERKPR
jgi:hypothetical protein